MASVRRKRWYLTIGLTVALAVLCAVGWVGFLRVRALVDGGRGAGERALTAIGLPSGWRHGPIDFHDIRQDMNYPDEWRIDWYGPSDAATVFPAALQAAGWHRCDTGGDTCWEKEPYQLRLTYQGSEAAGTMTYIRDAQN